MSRLQKSIFLKEEGDSWFRRNKGALDSKDPRIDPVVSVLTEMKIVPSNILEVGASNGWRLDFIKKLYPNAYCVGVEPSHDAIHEASSDIKMILGTADFLDVESDSQDLLIYGFCLYLCDPADLFKIACEGDRVLRDGGYVLVYDFLPDYPYRRPYDHYSGLYSHKMNYSEMFLWHPAYSLVRRVDSYHSGTNTFHADDRVSTLLLRKKVSVG